ncbi:hypothetical protein HY442_00945 [Candidatus Parcubacteria bacterium]|nr:hypothetical protein [Candidatus Parcubacteria bacterium]MBI4385494.1 hypothetical protein [Candidatus Parcubacteria bacterium]
MRDDLKDAGDRIMLWYSGLTPQNRQTIDPNGSIAHLLERRRELTSRLVNVNLEMAVSLAERISGMPRDQNQPIEYVLRTLNAALEQRIARGWVHDVETDRLAELIGKAYQYAINVVGYPVTFADGVLDSALKQLARARAAAK